MLYRYKDLLEKHAEELARTLTGENGKTLDDSILDLMARDRRFLAYVDIPLQHVARPILSAMRRGGDSAGYLGMIERMRSKVPDISIRTTFIVGFPGETEAEFEETRRMIEDLPFTYLHVFTYSARPGTPAAAMAKQVPVQVARERNRILRELAAEKKLAFMRSFVGKTLEAITLNVIGGDSEGEFTEALTDNYLKLRLQGRHQANRWRTVSVQDVVSGSLVGQ